MVNLKPDIVVEVGDIFNDNYNLIRNPDRQRTFFSSTKATYGVYVVLGNHDGGKTLNEMIIFSE